MDCNNLLVILIALSFQGILFLLLLVLLLIIKDSRLSLFQQFEFSLSDSDTCVPLN